MDLKSKIAVHCLWFALTITVCRGFLAQVTIGYMLE